MGNSAVSGFGPYRRLRVLALAVVFAIVAGVLVSVGAPTSAEAASPCGADINAVVCENQKAGTDPAVWDISGAGDSSIQGFATDISVNVGSKIDFKIDTTASAYTIDIYRTGYYQGLGARYIASVNPSATLPQKQPQCISDISTELYDCGTWGVSASWNVPADAVSGVYIAKLTRTDTGGASHIIFIVRNDGNHSAVLFQTSDPTWQAYNTYGGSDFYQGAANGRAFKISYNRPFATRGNDDGRDFYFSSEYATVRFLEQNGYDVSYLAGVDTDRRGGELLNHKAFLSVGHDEYWSAAQRTNIAAARDAGVGLQFLTGNEGYWHTRYENSVDGSNTSYRTLVSYKETWSNAKIDPTSEWTGTWRDPRFATAATGGTLPENNLTGTMYMVNDVDLAVTVSSDEGKTRLWRNTSLASLASGTTAALAAHTIGYESNEDIDNGFRPQGLVRLSTTVGSVPQYLTDYGNVVVSGTTQHHVTLYKAASGALVFSAASIQWGWGLDAEHDGNGAPADVRMQQAQVNLLADMGAQPGTLMAGLVAATKSTDTTAPTTTIASPTEGQSVANGAQVTVTGTAADVGGRVAGVEVSTDGGSSWHPATGTTNWTYTYFQQGLGTTPIIARAIDDSANFSSAGTTRNVNVTGSASVFGDVTPPVTAANDAGSYELGLRFTPNTDGFITGVRFYKGTGNTGTHVGSLWDSSGNRIASVTFTNETASGWQTAQFQTPVAVVAGTAYTVSYTAPSGHYAVHEMYWPYHSTNSFPITVSNGIVGNTAAGVYGGAGNYPTATYGQANYFVDVTFTKADTSALRISARTPVAGASSVALDAAVSATFTRAADPATVSMVVKDVNGAVVAGTVSYDAASKTARFAPASPFAASMTYSVSPAAKDTAGVALESGSSWSFTTQGAELPEGQCPCSLYPESSVPTVASDADRDSVTVGVRFTVQTAGKITGVKFYKGTANTGTHVGALWKADGTQLATVTFQNESTSGWQTATFATPIDVVAGQTYTASYLAPGGAYAVNPGQFGSDYSRGPLTVPAGGGAYTYAGGFPGQSSSASYGVDVVFVQAAQAPTLVSTSPSGGAVDVAAGAALSATFSGPIANGFTGTVKANGTVVPGAWALSTDAKTATFTPSAALTRGASVAVTMTGLVGANGVAVADVAWSFSVQAPTGETLSTFFASTVPAVAAETGDTASVELGLAFTTSVVGEVRAIRFYKGAGNSGTHTGSLWAQDGTRLAQVTFTDETASGWQRAVLSTPVVIGPGQTYTVSYLAPNGRYSYTSAALNSEVSSGPLKTIATQNGRYRYGAGGTVPTASWNSTNYFVDVEFAVQSALAVTATTPARGADAVAIDSTVSATVGGVGASQTPTLQVAGPGGAVAGTSSFTRTTGVVKFTPTSPLQYSGNYVASVLLDGATLDSWTFRAVDAPADTVQNLFGTETPAVAAVTDTDPVEVGTAFTVAAPGRVTAIRFYKGDGNTGVHRGTLWDQNGTALSQVTFTAESASGWQTAALASPIAVSPGQTYTVSYFSPGGKYGYTGQYFADAKVAGKITGIATTNGRFFYGANGGFPTSSWGSSAYFVDPVIDFRPQLTATTPGSGATGVNPAAAITATLTNASSAALTVTAGGTAVAGSSSFNSATGVVSFTPATTLDRAKSYTVTVTANGASIDGGSWSFTTAANAALTATTPTASATNVDPAAPAITATLTNASSASLALTSGGAAVAGTSNFNATTGVVTFTPTAALAYGASYSVATTANGAAVANGTWTFSTRAAATLSSTTPAANATNVDPATVKVTATLANATAGTIVLKAGTTTVAGTSAFNATTGVVTFTPTAALGWTTAYTATVTANSGAVANGTWSFTTMAKQDQVSLFPTGTPTNANTSTLLNMNVGTRFKSSAAGVVTAIKFYKGTSNTGTHTGYLWNSSGQQLATVVFAGETASGWQTATLSTPVRLTVGAEYRVSMYSTSKFYAATTSGLSAVVTNGPISTIANGGAYSYTTGYPSTTSSTKYWIDVVFDPDN